MGFSLIKNKNMIQEHHFNIEDAKKYGVEKAILLYNIRFWLEKNKANDKHRHGKNGVEYYWTYNSGAAFAELFPYFGQRSIERWLVQLEKDGVIIVGNYNKNSYDRTKWFTMPSFAVRQNDESNPPKEPFRQSGKTVRQNDECIRQDGEPIPDSNTDKKTPFGASPEKPPFDSEEEINKLFRSNKPQDEVIAGYFYTKKLVFNNAKQLHAEYVRSVKTAARLANSGYSTEEIYATMEYCEKKFPASERSEFQWKLETVEKYLAIVVADLKKRNKL